MQVGLSLGPAERINLVLVNFHLWQKSRHTIINSLLLMNHLLGERGSSRDLFLILHNCVCCFHPAAADLQTIKTLLFNWTFNP